MWEEPHALTDICIQLRNVRSFEKCTLGSTFTIAAAPYCHSRRQREAASTRCRPRLAAKRPSSSRGNPSVQPRSTACLPTRSELRSQYDTIPEFLTVTHRPTPGGQSLRPCFFAGPCVCSLCLRTGGRRRASGLSCAALRRSGGRRSAVVVVGLAELCGEHDFATGFAG